MSGTRPRKKRRPKARKPHQEDAPAYWAARREHAQQRIQAGAELTPDERRQLTEETGWAEPEPDIAGTIAAIEFSIIHYWHMLLSLIHGDVGLSLRKIESLAAELAQTMAGVPRHPLDGCAEADSEWRIPEHHAGRVAVAQHVIERMAAWARNATSQMPPARAGRRKEAELRWLLTGLRHVWTERLGRAYLPQETKRCGIKEFVAAVLAIADPYVPAARAIRLLPPAEPLRRHGLITEPKRPQQ
jgi:hypothetical protein